MVPGASILREEIHIAQGGGWLFGSASGLLAIFVRPELLGRVLDPPAQRFEVRLEDGGAARDNHGREGRPHEGSGDPEAGGRGGRSGGGESGGDHLAHADHRGLRVNGVVLLVWLVRFTHGA
jgi:hypothetical protein